MTEIKLSYVLKRLREICYPLGYYPKEVYREGKVVHFKIDTKDKQKFKIIVEGTIPFKDIVSNLSPHLHKIKETILKRVDIFDDKIKDEQLYKEFVEQSKIKYHE